MSRLISEAKLRTLIGKMLRRDINDAQPLPDVLRDLHKYILFLETYWARAQQLRTASDPEGVIGETDAPHATTGGRKGSHT